MADLGKLAYILAEKAQEFARRDVTPFFPREVMTTVVLQDGATTAAQVFNSLKVPTTTAFKATILIESTNNVAVRLFYSPDGVKELAKDITGVADVASGKFIYTITLDAPIYYLRFRATETATAGYVYGSVTLLERKAV